MKWILLVLIFSLSACVPTAKNNPLALTVDNTPPSVSVPATNTVSEAGGSVLLTATLSKVYNKTVTIPIQTYGTATLTSDYAVSSSTITIPAGSLTGSVTVTIANDALTEGHETILVILKTPTNATLSSNKIQTITIVDDEYSSPLPNASFSAATSNSTELNTGSSANVTVTVNLSAATTYDIFVPITISASSTATKNVDYTLNQNFIQITAGLTSGTGTVTIIGDSIYESAVNETIIINMGNPVGAFQGATTTHTIDLIENDAPPTIHFHTQTLTANTITEGAGTFNVIAELSAPAAVPLTYTVTAAGVEAIANGVDFHYPSSGITLTIPAYATTHSTLVNIIDDTIYDRIGVTTATTETFTLTLGGGLVVTGTNPVTVSITENDTIPAVNFGNAGITTSESAGTVNIPVTLSSPVQSATDILYTVGVELSAATGGGVDYTIPSLGTLTIPAGSTSGIITITLNDDAFGEISPTVPEETITLTLAASAGYYTVGANNVNTTYIVDNDPSPQLNFNVTSATISEAAGVATIDVDISLTNPSGSIVSGSIAVTGGTATNVTDYTITNTGSTPVADLDFSFTPGQTTPDETIQIRIPIEVMDEFNETLILGFTAVANATVGTNNSYTLTILDNDTTPTVNFSSVAGIHNENVGAPVTITATLSDGSDLDITVPFTLTGTATQGSLGDGTDYYTNVTGSLTFPAGSIAGATATLTFNINDDTLYETVVNETIVFTAGSATNALIGTNSSQTIQIQDDDVAAPTLGFSAASSSVTENSTTVPLTINISHGSSETITVPITLGAGTASINTDFVYSPSSVTFAPCTDDTDCTLSQTVNVVIYDDTESEGASETVILNIGAPTSGTIVNGTMAYTLTINDEDFVANVDTASGSGDEATPLSFTISLEDGKVDTTGVVTVAYTVSGTATSGTDYAALPGTVNIAMGANTSPNITITPTDDVFNEKDETVIITITSVTPTDGTKEGVVGTSSSYTGTISANDSVLTYTSSYMGFSAGGSHTCVIKDQDVGNNLTMCWGFNSSGQLGNATTANNVGDFPGEMGSGLTALTLTAPTQIAAGKYHTCALDGVDVKCWGDNTYGQVGNGAFGGTVTAPFTVTLAGTPVQVVTGDYHSCALINDGSAECWGYNAMGQLGANSTTSLNVPTPIFSITNLIAIAAGGDHTCAINNANDVFCWGDNDFGQLGQDHVSNLGDAGGEMAALSADPVDLGVSFVASGLALGRDHSCALDSSNGHAKCWGKNLSGQLGQDNVLAYGSDPSGNTITSLANILPGEVFTQVRAGGDSTCLLNSSNELLCFGNNQYGQLGVGSTSNLGDNPLEMATVTPIDLGTSLYATDMTIGEAHACARLNNGQIKCWGYNNYGQLGLENSTTKGDSAGEMGNALSSPSF